MDPLHSSCLDLHVAATDLSSVEEAAAIPSLSCKSCNTASTPARGVPKVWMRQATKERSASLALTGSAIALLSRLLSSTQPKHSMGWQHRDSFSVSR